jgi:hypothetical protein
VDIIDVPTCQRSARPWARLAAIGPPANHRDIPNLIDCGTLPSLVEAVSGEATMVRSYWSPSEQERARLFYENDTVIELAVCAWPMVPVSVAVVKGDPPLTKDKQTTT